MGYKDKTKQAEYQRKWMAERRTAWLKAHGPCKKCGSWEQLRIATAAEGGFKHGIWSWSEEGRAEALKDCFVLCREHQREHYGKIFGKKYRGRKGQAEKFSAAEIWAIRGRLLGRETTREIARAYNTHHSAIIDIQKGRVWSWLKAGRGRSVYGVRKVKESQPSKKRGKSREEKAVESERALLQAVAEAADAFQAETRCYSTGISLLSEESMKELDDRLLQAFASLRAEEGK